MSSGNPKSVDMRGLLGKRDRQILSDVLLYRLTTNELVGTRQLVGLSANAVTKVTARLVRDKWLRPHSLFEKRVYFVPGKSMVSHYGLPVSRMQPLGTQALASHLSVATYCLDASRQFQLLSPNQFSTDWSWIPNKLRALPHAIIRADDKLQVRTLRVDLGGTPVHVATKCIQDINLRRNIPGYKQLQAERALINVVLTPTESKKQAIVSAIQKCSWPVNTRFDVTVVPVLCRLLTR